MYLIRVGIVGCGYWGPNLVRTFNEIDGVAVVRVSDLRPGRREFVKNRYPSIQTTADAGEILTAPDIDAVVIATPPDTHAALAVEALDHGKHLLVEKPLATSAADAAKVVALAASKHLVLTVGHLFLYSPAFTDIDSLLRQGELGDLYTVSCVRCNLGPPNTQVDVLWDLAPHDISMILKLMDDAPVEVRAVGASFTNAQFAETVFTTLRFADGRVASIHSGWLTPAKTRTMQIICSRRVVVYDDMQPVQKVQVYDPGIDNRVHAGAEDASALGFAPGGIWVPPLKTYEPLRAECEDFIACIRSGARPLSDGVRALEVVRVLEAATQALRAGGQSAYAGLEIEPRPAEVTK